MTYSTYVVVNGLVFPESPRWHQGCFWFTDQFSGRIMTLTLDGLLGTVATLPDHAGAMHPEFQVPIAVRHRHAPLVRHGNLMPAGLEDNSVCQPAEEGLFHAETLYLNHDARQF